MSLVDEAGVVVQPEKRPTFLALTSGKTVSARFAVARKDKKYCLVAITAAPIVIKGKVVGAIKVFRDITHETEVDRAKTEFVSIASHQLRTPIGIIKWYLEAIRQGDFVKQAPQKAKEYIGEIQKSNERILSLVRNLLSVSRIDQHRVVSRPKSTDVVRLVRSIVDETKLLADKHDVTLKLVLAKHDFGRIYIDPTCLREVVENLVMNAIQYNKHSGTVQVSIKKTAPSLLSIAVKDTGTGLTEADKDKLFSKFFRSQEAAQLNTDGSGLGLYVVKSYVEGWGGKVVVTSKKGHGSTFSITIPIKKAKKG